MSKEFGKNEEIIYVCENITKMKNKTMKCIKLLSVVLVLFGYAIVGSSQTLQEVTDARNKGAELMAAGDLDGAITELEKCVDLAIKVGEEADEHRFVAEGALPNLYLQKAEKLTSTRD